MTDMICPPCAADHELWDLTERPIGQPGVIYDCPVCAVHWSETRGPGLWSRLVDRVRSLFRRATGARPFLDEWSARHADPTSGVWAVCPPCGYGWWNLWAPGAADPAADFPYSGEPFARHPANLDDDYGEEELADIEHWLLPWLEETSGGLVVELVDGWCAPYGPRRGSREYVIYARVLGDGRC